MATVSLDHQNQNQNQNHHCKSHHRSSPFDVDLGASPIPPRRLPLDRKAKLRLISTNEALISRSCVVGVKSQPEGGEAPADSLWLALHKFLASKKEEECNWPVVDTYSCDDFRMYEFKVRKCMRGRSHDWTECPFAHPGEKARRRDPRRFHYSGTVCPDFRKGRCRRGDACEFAHGVFECWLHPARYRTQPCKDGRNCKRKVCFFAHTPQQLRVLPILQNGPSPRPTASCNGFYLRYPSENPDSTTLNMSCPLCYPRSNHFPFVYKASRVPPPISTLRASCHVSPSLSPPISPPVSPVSLNDCSVKNIQNKTKGFSAEYSPIRSHQATMAGNSLNNHPSGTNVLGYQNLLAELVNSLEAIDLASINNHPGWGSSTENDQNSPLFFPGLSFSADSAPCHVNEQYGVQHPHSDSFFSGEKTTASSGSSNFYSPDLEWIKELVM